MPYILPRQIANLLRGRTTFSTALDAKLLKEIRRISVVLEEAVESTKYISISAQQAYLETDPAQRDLPESYSLRYLCFARDQVADALSQYDDLHNRIGEASMKKAESEQASLALSVADALLARDQLRAQIRADEDRMESKRSGTLSREDLTFCEGPQ